MSIPLNDPNAAASAMEFRQFSADEEAAEVGADRVANAETPAPPTGPELADTTEDPDR